MEFTTLGDSVIYFHSDHSVPGRVFSLEFGVTLTQLFRLVDSEGLIFYFIFIYFYFIELVLSGVFIGISIEKPDCDV